MKRQFYTESIEKYNDFDYCLLSPRSVHLARNYTKNHKESLLLVTKELQLAIVQSNVTIHSSNSEYNTTALRLQFPMLLQETVCYDGWHILISKGDSKYRLLKRSKVDIFDQVSNIFTVKHAKSFAIVRSELLWIQENSKHLCAVKIEKLFELETQVEISTQTFVGICEDSNSTIVSGFNRFIVFSHKQAKFFTIYGQIKEKNTRIELTNAVSCWICRDTNLVFFANSDGTVSMYEWGEKTLLKNFKITEERKIVKNVWAVCNEKRKRNVDLVCSFKLLVEFSVDKFQIMNLDISKGVELISNKKSNVKTAK